MRTKPDSQRQISPSLSPRLQRGPLFRSVVELMIGMTLSFGLVHAGPQYAVQTDPVTEKSKYDSSQAGPRTAGSPERADADGVSWLDATIEANFNDRFIRELLDEIGPGVTNAFLFARDKIGFDAYTGSLRGARGTLWSQAGNSLDQASLLIALSRGEGIEARYARGLLSKAGEQTLIRSMFDPVVAANAVGYIPERFPRSDPEHDSDLLNTVAEHWWVELEDGTQLVRH